MHVISSMKKTMIEYWQNSFQVINKKQNSKLISQKKKRLENAGERACRPLKKSKAK